MPRGSLAGKSLLKGFLLLCLLPLVVLRARLPLLLLLLLLLLLPLAVAAAALASSPRPPPSCDSSCCGKRLTGSFVSAPGLAYRNFFLPL